MQKVKPKNCKNKRKRKNDAQSNCVVYKSK